MANEEIHNAPVPSDPTSTTAEIAKEETTESFADAFSQFEKEHTASPGGDPALKEGVIVSLNDDALFVDIGLKIEGVLPRAEFKDRAEGLAVGDKLKVSVKGRNEEGYYPLSLARVVQPVDWAALERAFEQKATVAGTVTGVVKGGLTVDIGVRAFLPASRSGTRDAAELEKLVGQEITCRITKLDVAEENAVVDRRSVLEEQSRAAEQRRYAELAEGDVLSGTVRSLTSYGAFVDLGGVDGLLHISDMAWGRIGSPEEVVSVGQPVQVKVLKLDQEGKRISLGLKQLQPEPWDDAAERYPLGKRVSGTVRRLTDFGAFVEVEPGIEGLIHVSEMSWVKKVRRPADVLKLDDTVEAVVLALNTAERRLSLGLKQALGDPWADVAARFPVGSVIEGPVTRLATFGAFVQLAEGVEGLVHISEIVPNKRLNHPQEALHVGEMVKAQVLGVDTEKRQLKLSIKQLVPTQLDDFLAEHAAGDTVSGRITAILGEIATVELGDGIVATCSVPSSASNTSTEAAPAVGLDLSALSSMLNARWKGETKASSQPQAMAVGQLRTFRITALDAEAKKVSLEFVE